MIHGKSDLLVEKSPLRFEDLPDPIPSPHEVLIKVSACAVCHTEIDEIEGRTPPSQLPVVPGHQVVGTIQRIGTAVTALSPGDRVGVAWIFSSCGHCRRCREGNENLCEEFKATGRDVNGGYAEFMVAPSEFVHPLPTDFSDAEVAPLLCAGAIGHRSLRLSLLQDGDPLGLTGFGASGHLVLQLAHHLYPSSEIYVFARSKDEREFALHLGAVWTGESMDTAPRKLRAIIDTTPAWVPVVGALKNLEPGGRLVVNAIRKEEKDKTALAGLDYAEHLWKEKEIKTVANVTRRDVREFLDLAARIPIRPRVEEYPLEDANKVIAEIKRGNIRGAKVLRVS